MQIGFPGGNLAGIKQRLSGNSGINDRVYSSFDQMNRALLKYGDEQTRRYEKQFNAMENGGKIGLDELKETIRNEFPGYRMVSSEPADVVDGQNLLYIDKNNLRKMADNPEYRAKVFGLIRREGDSIAGTTKIRLNGDVHHFQTSGSVFSLSDKNQSVGGIPYKGTAKSMPTFMPSNRISTTSHTAMGRDESWYEKLLERMNKRREESRAQLKEVQEKNQIERAEQKKIDVYL